MLLKNIRKLLFYFVNFLFSVAVVAFGLFYYFGRDLPSELTLLDYSPPTTTKIFSSNQELIEEYAIERRIIVSFDKIPTLIKGAFIVAEDRSFYRHHGISLQSLIRAIIDNTKEGNWKKRPAGGSTITQQIAKNLLVGSKRSYSRKIREAIMAFRIERSIPKDKILEIYLNQLYLGKGSYGIVEACDYYFNKSLDEIEAHEAAFLASIPNAPSIYINMKDNSKILLKRNSILYQMYELGYISKKEFKNSINIPIKINTLKKNKIFSPYFSDEIFKIFLQRMSKDSFFRGGYEIVTTMDKRIQRLATKALEDGIIDFTNKNKSNYKKIGNIKNTNLNEIAKNLPSTINSIFPCYIINVNKTSLKCKMQNSKIIDIQIDHKSYKDTKFEKGDVILCRLNDKNNKYELYQNPEITGGIAVMDAKNGDILAISGGYSFDISSFNCMTQSLRQPGSTIKPFVYAAALEEGLDEYDTIEDKPVNIKLDNGKIYSPRNYSGKCYGKTHLRDGLIYSRNLTTINLALKIKTRPISKLLKSAELIKNKIPISGVLGSVEVIPINLLSSFSAFVNKGTMVYPNFIKSIKSSNLSSNQDIIKDILYKKPSKRIISKKTADIIKNILIDTVKIGTASKLSKIQDELNLEIIGKTGTTNDFKDAWFIGSFSDDSSKTYLVCVFIGYKIPKSLGDNASGARVALPIFENFLRYFYSK